MAVLPNELETLKGTITHALRDISHPNPLRLKAGLRILMTTNIDTFEKVCSKEVQNDLASFKKMLLNPETIITIPTANSEKKEVVLSLIKKLVLDNIFLIDNRTAILPNTYMVKKTLMEGERLKSVIHSSALRNVFTTSHYVDTLAENFKKEGYSQADCDKQVKKVIDSIHQLHQAVEQGNISQVLQALSVDGVDVNFPDEQGQTPLHIATRVGLIETVKLLLTVPGIQVNLPNNNGWAALHMAARLGFGEIVEALIKMPDIDVNRVNSDGWTALHWAAWHGFTDIVTLLLRAPGITLNPSDKNMTTPLHWAARNGHPDVISILLSQPEVQINLIDSDKRTPLCLAAMYSHEDAIMVLLNYPGIDVNAADLDGLTPLHWAARNGGLKTIQQLLQYNDIILDGLDHNGTTPLEWASRNGHLEIVNLLRPHTQIRVAETPPSLFRRVINKFLAP